MFKSFSDAETGILFCTVSYYKLFGVCLPSTIFYPLLFLLAPQIQYQSKRASPWFSDLFCALYISYVP